MEIVIVLTTF